MIAVCATIFGAVYLFYTTRNRERLALIDKGADASLFNTGKGKGDRKPVNWGKFALKTGMFFIGIGLGIIAGAIIESLEIMPKGADYTSMIFVFGGLSLVLFYLFDRKIS